MSDSSSSSKAPFKVRRMTPEDFPEWIAMRNALWPDCPEERHRLEVEQLVHGEGPVFLAVDGRGTAIGFAEVSLRRDHVEGTEFSPVPYLEGWYVAPDWRGRGVGRTLVEAVAAWAVREGYRELASDAVVDNEASIQAHGRLGFQEVERTVHFVRKLKSVPEEP